MLDTAEIAYEKIDTVCAHETFSVLYNQQKMHLM